jgi:hypothetical protein
LAAKYILIVLAALFFLASIMSVAREGRLTLQSRTWLLVTLIFAAVSAWLWIR